MEFFNNTNNDNLKFKLNSEGININKIEPRLILTTSDNVNYFFIGKIKNEVCEFEIPELTLYEKNDSGKIKFEIISEDLYFPVWEDEFKIVTRASIKIEEMFVTENKISDKPKITTDLIFEKPKNETKDDLKERKNNNNNNNKLKHHIDLRPLDNNKPSGFKKFSEF